MNFRQGRQETKFRILVGKCLGKWPLGRPRMRWEGNVTMILRETGCKIVRWMDVAQVHVQLLDFFITGVEPSSSTVTEFKSTIKCDFFF
jgi:hypothetical protein